MSIPPEVFDNNWQWIIFDFDDIETIPGIDYFIVVPPAPSGVTTSFGYEWGYSFGDYGQARFGLHMMVATGSVIYRRCMSSCLELMEIHNPYFLTFLQP